MLPVAFLQSIFVFVYGNLTFFTLYFVNSFPQKFYT